MADSDIETRRFRITTGIDILKFLVEIAIAIGIFYFGHKVTKEEARPRLESIGAVPQFAGPDNFMTVRVKNFSTRQDAVITRVEFVVTDEAFLKCIRKRRPFEKNSPAVPKAEHILSDKKDVQLTRCDWDPTGKSFKVEEDLDISVAPGKAEAIRFCIGKPSWNEDEWKDAWFTGALSIHYDNEVIKIPQINFFQKDLKGVGAIPPNW